MSAAPDASALLVRALTEALTNLNKLDDLMVQYDDKGLPKVTSQINEFVGSLGKIKASQDSVQAQIPLELLVRMDQEDLNPSLYSLETLEKIMEEVKSQERGQSMLEEVRSTLINETKEGQSQSEAKAGEEATGADDLAVTTTTTTTTTTADMDVSA